MRCYHLMSHMRYWGTPKKIFVGQNWKKMQLQNFWGVLFFTEFIVRYCMNDMLSLFCELVRFWRFHKVFVMFYYCVLQVMADLGVFIRLLVAMGGGGCPVGRA